MTLRLLVLCGSKREHGLVRVQPTEGCARRAPATSTPSGTGAEPKDLRSQVLEFLSPGERKWISFKDPRGCINEKVPNISMDHPHLDFTRAVRAFQTWNFKILRL